MYYKLNKYFTDNHADINVYFDDNRYINITSQNKRILSFINDTKKSIFITDSIFFYSIYSMDISVDFNPLKI